MAARSNAIAEITRFWLQSRHGCLVDESVPVKVRNGHSDIDFVALRSDLSSWLLPDGTQITRAIIETKDEHDFDPNGRDFGRQLRQDLEKLAEGSLFIPAKVSDVKFSMLRQEHFEKASQLFGTDDFDRLFVVHDLHKSDRDELAPTLANDYRIHWITIREVVSDLQQWYPAYPSKAALRHTLMGDLWHLLFGYCNQ